MAFTSKLNYKGKPLVRCGKELYYGKMSAPYVAHLQILSTKSVAGMELADAVQVTILSTDTTKSPAERIMRKSTKNGLYNALDIGSIWLERALQM